ncbi:putative heme oxygenase superfamily protein [Golovinomyces cichoracearum]|uniref:Putative heme oxygenase superfamily protein n=1 Tax=Golovinomyces cichoracearum TaxID=62708 RepID=A0A420I941_9PEZI|nr:putative heme oxygenase superfamily protein [Golovinomyces cichoracearum]
MCNHCPNALSLSEQINAATREYHTSLNRLILQRLPLALPPHASDPSIYITGLLHFATIYITFEELWTQILAPYPDSINQKSCDLLDHYELENQSPFYQKDPKIPKIDVPVFIQKPRACPRIESILRRLHVPGLSRTERLRADIGNLIHIPRHEVDKKLDDVLKSGSMSTFLNHIKKSVKQNPHVLLAYSWILYMALFSGGRFLRASLREAGGLGVSFWSQDFPPDFQHYDSEEAPKTVGLCLDVPESKKNSLSSIRLNTQEKKTSPIISGLHFFYFAGETDGEDLKVEFKKRMKETEILLTKSEKMDVILEAQHIFKYLIRMVWELDALMRNHDLDDEEALEIEKSKLLVGTRNIRSLGQTLIWQKYQEKNPEQKWKSRFSDLNIKNTILKVVTFEWPFPILKNAFAGLVPITCAKMFNSWSIFSNFNPVGLNLGPLILSSLGLILGFVALSLAYEILEIKINH